MTPITCAPYTMKVDFNDGLSRQIDFRLALVGEMHGPLQDLKLFEQVTLDPEVHTLVWPNGADFDAATLHDWPENADEVSTAVQDWSSTATMVMRDSPKSRARRP